VAYTALPHRTEYQTSGQSVEPVSSNSTASSRSSKSDKTDKVEKNEPREWTYISDTVVRLTTLDEVLKSKAYMCLYERVS